MSVRKKGYVQFTRTSSCLDSLGKEVSGPFVVFRVGQGRGQLVEDTNARLVGLPDKSHNGNHCQTSVLCLLNLLLEVFFGGVVESEGVESSVSLSPSEVTWGVRRSQSPHSLDAEKIHETHEGNNLPDTSEGGFADGSHRVGCDTLKSWDACESREDESKDGHLGDTSVHEFDLTVPFNSGKAGVSGEGKTVEVVSHQVGLGGQEAWVETDISGKTSVKGGGGVLERKSLRRDSSSTGWLGGLVIEQ